MTTEYALDMMIKGFEPECDFDFAGLARELLAARKVVGDMRDIAEQDCVYGDGCPKFGSRHGVCFGCLARRSLTAYDAATKGE